MNKEQSKSVKEQVKSIKELQEFSKTQAQMNKYFLDILKKNGHK